LQDFNAEVREVKLYLLQHIGVPSIPIVKVGDSVIPGQVVAEIPEGKAGAKVHSSIAGTVSEITDCHILVKS
jgi:Na+-translocating ferredoxin:NAD+ oxidoreductase RnfC subunit